jgi:N-acetylglutamate synthase-like GNAT family acetyltransferase
MESTDYNIVSATHEDIELLEHKLDEFNRNQIPLAQKKTAFKNYVIKEGEKIIAGISAMVFPWGVLFVDVVFVEDNRRKKGLGSSLLQKVEAEAKAMGATVSNLNSFDFQAKDFYLKQGYEIFGVLEDSPKDHNLYFLKKNL